MSEQNGAPPPAPPQIAGYQFLDALGAGGFAAVYLYEQESPRRRVAIKVLHPGQFSDAERRQFRDEANLMAQLSSHPSIVTILHSGVTDDARPYIVMEYCPRPNLGARFRTERIGVDEALAVGIQIAGAVESAHRAGVLHRDIKPANILVTEYNRPALADFGIASTLAQGAAGRGRGLSVPWAPPESFAPTPWAGPASDVYALGATVYSLLAGRSPFERIDAPNDIDAIEARIAEGVYPPTGRPDVPPALETVLETAMSPSPQARYTSALSFARALQRLQQELGLPVTAVDVIDENFTRTAAVDTDQGRTRIHAVGAPDAATAAAGAASAATAGAATAGTVPATAAAPESTVVPPMPPLPPAAVLPPTTAPTQPYAASPPAHTAPTENLYATPAAPGYAAATPGQAPTHGYAAQPAAYPAAPGHPAAAPSIEHTVRRAPGATAPDFGPPPPRKRNPVPGIILDAVLVLGVAGAAAYLLLVK